MRTTVGLLLAATAAFGLGAASCGSDDSAGSTTAAMTGSDPDAEEVTGEITVFAAASLTAAYAEIGEAFTAAHPEATARMNFGASSELAAQIDQGAPADVFASADEPNMAKVVAAGDASGDPQVFATNALQIIVEPGNPEGITGVDDLDQPDLLYVTCAPEVPIGAYAAQVLENAGVSVTPVSFEESVKGIVTKVTLGEADAGIVYRTDVAAAGNAAEGVDIPAKLNVEARYPITVTDATGNRAAADAFVAFVMSDDAQRILASYGFGAP